MKTIVGLYREKRGVEQALDMLRRGGLPKDAVRIVTQDSNLGVELGGAGGGHIFTAELARGGTLVVVEPSDDMADTAMDLMRQAGADDIAVHDDAAGGNWIGTADGAGAGRSYGHAAGVAGKDRAEDSERNNWNEAERLAYGTEMGQGAAAGGTMGAPLGPGITQSAGGLMGATPGEHPADEPPIDMPDSGRQAEIERQRRQNDPAP
jgi:hypothetical protein